MNYKYGEKMKQKRSLPSLVGLAALLLALHINGAAQQLFLNEVEIDPPSTISDACQYAEVRGTPGAVVPANTYFVSINSDAGNFGFVNHAINFGGQTIGANGTISLVNNGPGLCTNRVFPAGTTYFEYFQALRIGFGSETYLIVQSTTTLFAGQDFDENDDGLFDPLLGITAIDGFALLVNPEEEYVYGANLGAVNISSIPGLEQPDAVSRFASNSTPFAIDAFYYGELAATPDETTEYAGPFSPNFPTGTGVLTPGAANVPGGASPTIAAVGGRVVDSSGRGIPKVTVIATAQNSRYRTITNNFGYYQFEALPTGSAYTVTATSKRYTFTSQMVTPTDSITNLNFSANP